MIAAYQRISRADGDLGKDGKDKSNSIENQKELILRYISRKESLQNLPVMDFVDDGYTGSNFDRPGFQQMMDGGLSIERQSSLRKLQTSDGAQFQTGCSNILVQRGIGTGWADPMYI